MVRHAAVTELLHEEVERVAAPMPFDEMDTNITLSCTDKMDTAFRISKRQRLHDVAESCTTTFAQVEGSLSIRHPTPLSIESTVPDEWFSHAAASGVSVSTLRPYESDAEEGEFCPCPSRSSGIGKRKRDTKDAWAEDSPSDTRIMRILVFVRLTPVDQLEPNVFLRAYSTILFCGFFSLFSPSLLD